MTMPFFGTNNGHSLRRLIRGMLAGLLAISLTSTSGLAAMSPEGLAKATRQALKDFASGNLEEARAGFLKVLDSDPDNVTALVNIGAVEFRLLEFDSAEAHLNKAVRLNPDATPAWITLGLLYMGRENLDNALAALSRAVVLEPDNWQAHNYLGVTIGRKGWLYGAEQELRRAIELNPEAAEPNFNLALIYMQRKPSPVELAKRHYREALRLGAKPDPLLEKQIDEAATASP